VPKKFMPVVVIVLVVFTAGLLFAAAKKHSADNNPVLHIVATTADPMNLTGKVDDTAQLDFKGTTEAAISVGPGTHTVSISKPGYNTFNQQVTIDPKQDVYIKATLQRTSEPTLNNLSNVEAHSSLNNLSLLSVQYFGAHDWAFATIKDTSGNQGYLVTHYDDTNKRWEVISGPVTTFGADEIGRFPSDLRTYLQKNNYVIEDSQ
jgi:hypothetical protein